MTDEDKTAALSFRVTPTIKSLVAKAAKADARSVSSWLEFVVLQRLRSEGLLSGGE